MSTPDKQPKPRVHVPGQPPTIRIESDEVADKIRTRLTKNVAVKGPSVSVQKAIERDKYRLALYKAEKAGGSLGHGEWAEAVAKAAAKKQSKPAQTQTDK